MSTPSNETAESRKARLDAERALYAAQGAAAIAKRANGDPSKGFICATCGKADAAVTRARGSLGMEVGLWLVGVCTVMFAIGIPILFIALIYSLWRLFARHRVCKACNSTELVPAASPRGLELRQRYHPSRPAE